MAEVQQMEAKINVTHLIDHEAYDKWIEAADCVSDMVDVEARQKAEGAMAAWLSHLVFPPRLVSFDEHKEQEDDLRVAAEQAVEILNDTRISAHGSIARATTLLQGAVDRVGG